MFFSDFPFCRWSAYSDTSGVGSSSSSSSYHPHSNLFSTLYGRESNIHRSYAAHIDNGRSGAAVLELDSSRLSDGSSFVCIANSSQGTDQMVVEVVPEPVLHVAVQPRHLTVDLAGTATFTCNPSVASASITWYFNGSPVVGRGRVSASGRQLLVQSVSHENEGMFQCFVQLAGQTVQDAGQLVLGGSCYGVEPLIDGPRLGRAIAMTRDPRLRQKNIVIYPRKRAVLLIKGHITTKVSRKVIKESKSGVWDPPKSFRRICSARRERDDKTHQGPDITIVGVSPSPLLCYRRTTIRLIIPAIVCECLCLNLGSMSHEGHATYYQACQVRGYCSCAR
ncbi:Immunoglobulin-like domain [Trinorchestia longiramus]|nr:Immunoglobulin-like domain [Trinorchestia longiramus]